jgi:hypothetical protein
MTGPQLEEGRPGSEELIEKMKSGIELQFARA